MQGMATHAMQTYPQNNGFPTLGRLDHGAWLALLAQQAISPMIAPRYATANIAFFQIEEDQTWISLP